MAIAARIKDARERSKWRQQDVADHLDTGLRAYQKLEKEGTSSFERCEELAAFLDVSGVTADYLWDGTETPDLMATLSAGGAAGLPEAVSALEGKMDQLLERMAALAATVEKQAALLDQQGKLLQSVQRGRTKGK